MYSFEERLESRYPRKGRIAVSMLHQLSVKHVLSLVHMKIEHFPTLNALFDDGNIVSKPFCWA